MCLNLRGEGGGIQSEEPIEEKKFGKDRGEVLTVGFAVVVGDRFPVEEDIAVFGRVESGEDFGEGGFAAAVAADDEDDFARSEFEGDGAEGEDAVIAIARVRVVDMLQLQRLPLGVDRGGWGEMFGLIGEGEIEGFDFVEGNSGLAEVGQAGDQAFEGFGNEDEGEQVAGEGSALDFEEIWEDEEQDAEGKEEGEFAEVVDQGKPTESGGLVVTVVGGGGLEVAREEGLAAAVIEFEFFGAVGDGAEVAKQVVLLVAALFEFAFGRSQNFFVHTEEQQDQHHDKEQNLPGEPQNVGQTARDHGEVNADKGQDPNGSGEGLDVVGEGGHEFGGPGTIEVSQFGGEDLLAEGEAEVVDRLLGEADQQQLGSDSGDQGSEGDQGEGDDRGGGDRATPLPQDPVHQGDDSGAAEATD